MRRRKEELEHGNPETRCSLLYAIRWRGPSLSLKQFDLRLPLQDFENTFALFDLRGPLPREFRPKLSEWCLCKSGCHPMRAEVPI
jgi:hypothetical protein